MRSPTKVCNTQFLMSLIIAFLLLGHGIAGAGELAGAGASAVESFERDARWGTNANWIFVDTKRAEISVSLRAVPLVTVLTEIARKTGIEIRFVNPELHSTATADFERLPLEKGLAQLLRKHDYAFFYTHTEGARRLAKVFILPTQGETLVETKNVKKPKPTVTAADRAILLEALRSARAQSIGKSPESKPRASTATPEAGNADADASRLLQALREQAAQQPVTSETNPPRH